MYDPSDESAEETFSTLLHVLRNSPDRLAKNVLSALLEETALLAALLEESGLTPPEGEDREAALGRLWDRVEVGRDRRAEALLHGIMKSEF